MKNKVKNNQLSENLIYNGSSPTVTHVHAIGYSPDSFEETIAENMEQVISFASRHRKTWLRVHGFQDTGYIDAICRHFGIDFLTVQDILNVEHPSKVEEHDDFNFVVSRVYIDSKELNIRIIQGKDYVISFTDGEASFFTDVHSALENNSIKIRNRGTDYLFSVLVNGLASNYIATAMEISDALDDMETELLTGTNGHDIGPRIQIQRRKYMDLKKIVLPLKDQYTRLLNSDSELISQSAAPFLNDVNDHLLNAMQMIDGCRETLSSLMELYISNNDMRMNDIMKKLTIVSTIFIPMTFLVGVWGMNFKVMPELEWKYGYAVAWGIMLLTGIGAYFIFRTSRWK